MQSTAASPFPDFDRTLQTLSGSDNGGFSFNLDPKLAGEDTDTPLAFPDLEAEAHVPFRGGFMDAFPAVRLSLPTSGSSFMSPPGLSYPHSMSHSIYDPLASRTSNTERQGSAGSPYVGSFNPFGAGEEIPQRQYSPLQDDTTRKVSRFDFARGRQGSTSSPMPTPSPGITGSDNASHTSYYPDLTNNGQQWSLPRRQQQDYQANSSMNSPVIQQAQAHQYHQQASNFQPFDSSVSEAQLRDLIQASRERANAPHVPGRRRTL